MAETRGKAWPLADEPLTNSVRFFFLDNACAQLIIMLTALFPIVLFALKDP